MLRSTPEWEAFEREWIRKEPKGYMRHIGVVNAMVEHVALIGHPPLRENPLHGLEDDIRLAKAMNAQLRLR